MFVRKLSALAFASTVVALTAVSATPAAAHLITGGGGAGAVPEPSTWAMLVVGFGSLGGLVRLRRRRVAA
jgi:hypothetical protein